MELYDRFLQYITYEKRYSKHTIRAYNDDIRSFFLYKDITNDNQILEITSKGIRHWILDLANSKISPRSYKRKLSSLKAFFRFLQKESELPVNPAENVIVPKHQNPLPDFLNTKETSILFEHANFPEGFRGERDRLILDLFYSTGIRLSELLSLTIRDIDFSLHQIRVVGKRNKQRNIPVSIKLLQAIKSYIQELYKEFGEEYPILFPTNKGNKPYPKFIQRLVNTYLKQATTSEKTNPHKLRHTFATQMLNNGADLNAVKELLGHANLAATEIYTHNTYEKLKSVYKQAHPRA